MGGPKHKLEIVVAVVVIVTLIVIVIVLEGRIQSSEPVELTFVSCKHGMMVIIRYVGSFHHQSLTAVEILLLLLNAARMR